MFRRPFSRGTSVLAALVFVAILGTVAYGVSAVTPGANPSAQLGQAVNATPVSPSQLAAQQALINGSTPSAKVKGDQVELKGAPRCNAPIDQKKNGSASSASAPASGVDNVCVPGCIYTVQKDTGAVDAKDPCADLPTGTPNQNLAKATCEKQRKCQVQICGTDGKCAESLSGSAADTALGRAARIPEYFKSDKEIQDALNKARAGADPTGDISKLPSWYQDAFKQAKEESQADVQNAIEENQRRQEIKLKELENATKYGSNDRVIQRIQDEQAALKTTEASLKQQAQNLENIKTIGADKADLSSSPPVNPSTLSKEAFTKAFCDSNPQDPSCGGAKETFIKNSGSPRDPGAGRGDPEPPSSGGLGGLGNALQSILGGLAKALGGAGGGSGGGQACASDPNAYAQQQQQYNAALQQYNLQLQQYNYQRQMNQYNGLPEPVPPQPPSQCTQTPSSNTCAAAPAKPAASGCANGSWKPVTTQQSNGASCTTSWQCVPGGSGVTPTAEISCQPKVADVGMSVAITYGCTNATESLGAGFDTGGATSGSTTTVIATPPDGANAINYGIQCRNQGLIGQAQCSVQIGKPSIVLLANPKIVPVNTASSVGWVTASMASCVVSSPDLPDFTAQNAGNTSVNGMATTSPLTQDTLILLHCITVGGNTKDATTTIQIATSTTP